jgi:hypothetical protein
VRQCRVARSVSLRFLLSYLTSSARAPCLREAPLVQQPDGTEARACSCGTLTTNHQKHLQYVTSKPVSAQVLQHNSVHTTERIRKEDKVRGARGTRFFAPKYQKPREPPSPAKHNEAQSSNASRAASARGQW